MRHLLFIVAIAFISQSALAIKAPGKVFYRMPDGTLAKRNVVLVHHDEGEKKGDVTMYYGDGASVDAHAKKVKKGKGRVIVSLLFIDPPGSPEGTALVMHGSLLVGKNAAVYYGDMYGGSAKDENKVTEQFLDSEEVNKHAFSYVGGFGFRVSTPN